MSTFGTNEVNGIEMVELPALKKHFKQSNRCLHPCLNCWLTATCSLCPWETSGRKLHRVPVHLRLLSGPWPLTSYSSWPLCLCRPPLGRCYPRLPDPANTETNTAVLKRRQKQIQYGKNTSGYQNYLQQVPKWGNTHSWYWLQFKLRAAAAAAAAFSSSGNPELSDMNHMLDP